MTELKIGQAFRVDGSKPLYVRLLGLHPGDSIEVEHGSAAARRRWNPRMAPLPWLKPTQNLGEFIVKATETAGPVAFLVGVTAPGSMGLSVARMGDANTVDHPGASPQPNRPWYLLTLEAQYDGALLVTAQDSDREDDGDGIPNIDSLSVVVDISSSMGTAVKDGRLDRALDSVRQAAARSNLAAITAIFVADGALDPKVLPVESSVPAILERVLLEHGNCTGVPSDLLRASANYGHSRDALFVISDNPPKLIPRRRAVAIATEESDPPVPGALYLRADESVSALTNRVIAAVPAF